MRAGEAGSLRGGIGGGAGRGRGLEKGVRKRDGGDRALARAVMRGRRWVYLSIFAQDTEGIKWGLGSHGEKKQSVE